MNPAATIKRAVEYLLVRPCAIAGPATTGPERKFNHNIDCYCGHAEHRHDNTGWCSMCSCSYYEPLEQVWLDYNPEEVRLSREATMGTDGAAG